MALLTGFQVSLDDINLLGEASMAAFEGKPIPAGWTVVTPAELGLGAQYSDGIYFTNGDSGASAIVLRNGNEFIIAFRGTDDAADVANYATLGNGSYLNYFDPLLDAVADFAPPDAEFSVTGASLGGGAVNLLANVAGSAYGGRFDDAKFIAFASPVIKDASGILNLGFENDPIYKVVNFYANRSSSLDNLVLATDEYLAGNYDGNHPYDEYAHSNEELGFEALSRLSASEFYNKMSPDSVVIFTASTGVVQDKHPDRAGTGAFYLGWATTDQIVGRAGDDFIEGFSGNDSLSGGAGSDRIKGGDGNDILNGDGGKDVLDGGVGDDRFVLLAAEAKQDTVIGGDGIDTLRVGGVKNLTLASFDAAASSIEIWQGNGMAVLGTKAANSFDFSGLTSITGTGIAYVDAGAGNDDLIGSAFGDVLRGNGGADTLTGGAGDDALSGGGGFDTFIFAAPFGKDTITDFTEGAGLADVIQFDDTLFADFAAVVAAAVQVGANVEIQLDADNVLTLQNVSLTGPGQLAADDFLFV